MRPTSRHTKTGAGAGHDEILKLLKEGEYSAALKELDCLSADECRLPAQQAEVSYYRALALSSMSRYADALAAARVAFSYYNNSVDHLRLAEILTIMGKSYAGRGDLKNARIQIRNALASFFRIGHTDGIIRSYNELARIEFIRGEFDLAVDHLTEAISHCEQEGNVDFRAKLVGNLGRIHLLRANWDGARESLELAERTQARLGNHLSVVRNQLSRGLLHIRQGKLAAATAILDEAAASITLRGYLREEAILHEYRGMLAGIAGDFDAAIAEFERALSLGRKVAEKGDLVAQSLRGLAEAYFEKGEITAAEKTANEALQVSQELGEKTEIGASFRVLGRFYAARQNSAEARKNFEQSLAVLRGVGDVFELAWTAYYHAEFLIRSTAPADHMLGRAALAECETKFSALGGEFWVDVPVVLRAALELSENNLGIAGRLISEVTDSTRNSTRPAWLFADRLIPLRAEWETKLAEHAAGEQNEYRIFRTVLSEGEARGLRGGDFEDTVRLLVDRLSADGSALILPHPETDEAECVYVHNLSESRQRRILRLIGEGPFGGFPLDRPAVISYLADQPNIYQFLNRNEKYSTESILTVPVVLGPEGTALLYLDRRVNGSRPPVFTSADIDFAVAFAEILGLKFAERQRSGLLQDNMRLKQQLNEKVGFPSIITANEQMIEMLSRVRLVMDSNVTILVQGETGTGKDLLAKAIHYNSVRRDMPYVSVNCAALPESLLESELFGYKKGAFTGADHDKKGLFEEADGGTFLLDEIGDMPLLLQTKLLRLLEEKEIIRLGETKPRKIDVRVISATNRDLKADAEAGVFRQDLYYRLSALSFRLIPLRERREDIPLLIDHFLEKSMTDGGKPPRPMPETLRRLVEYHWPGNIRELENEIKKLMLLRGITEEIDAGLLSRKFFETTPDEDEKQPAAAGTFSLYEHLATIEKKHLLRALAENKWIKKHAAKQLDIPESTLRLKMRQYKLERAKQ
jgi:transcriptional regulator with GAF, ATPase, and Fis domain/Tfp pilus assembly protein PilF